jgi:hypothetical protein
MDARIVPSDSVIKRQISSKTPAYAGIGIHPNLKEISMEPTISTKDLKARLDRKDAVKVVETLAPERYREAHIPGALNIPPEKIKELAPQLLPNKHAEIVTYCTSTH